MPPKKANGRKRSKDPRENKSEAMRQVIGALGMDAPITEIQDMLLNKFGHTMSANMVSSYRSTLRQGKGKRKKKGRRRAAALATAEAPARVGGRSDEVPMKDLLTLKDMASRLGGKRLQDLVGIVVH
jgi:hypothetical protein